MLPIYCSQHHENAPTSRFCSTCGERLAAPESEPIGLLLGGRYRVVRQLGQGGFGRTYLAEDSNRFNEPCVLKEFAPQVRGSTALQKAKELFEREAGVLYQLQHPQIPRFRELFRAVLDHERLFLVQDYVEGLTYRQLLEARRQQGQFFTEAELRHLLAQLLPVLAYIHSLGVIHRDLSPDNLILRSADQMPVLIDFGGVKQVAVAALSQYVSADAETVVPPTRLGKYGYAPVEQMHQGIVSPQSDLYALAMTLYVLLTGREPVQGDPVQSFKTSLSPELAAILSRMLAYQPSDRFDSAESVQTALGLPISSTLPPAAPLISTLPTQLPAQLSTQMPTQTSSGLPQVASAGLSPNLSPDLSPDLPPAALPTQTGGGRTARAKRLPALLALALVPLLLVPLWIWRGRWLPQLSSWVANLSSDLNQPQPEPQPPAPNPLEQRAQTAGIDYGFLINLSDATFAQRYPAEAGRVLSDGEEDAEWRQKWAAIADEWLTVLPQTLSPEARQGLGSYTEASRSQWKQQINQLYVGSRSLFDLTDAQFLHRFPDASDALKSQNFLSQPLGQIWQAIATDQIRDLQAGNSLKQIQFAPGTFSHQETHTLPAGGGQVYTANLAAGQLMRLNVQVPPQSSQLSIYLPRPTPSQPVLLEDSRDVTWAGKLPQSGYYEIVIVNTAQQPIRYQLNLAVDNVTSSPIAPAQGEAPEAKD
ncbi:MAG: protein kinase domain-containing protein [Elainella sp.]